MKINKALLRGSIILLLSFGIYNFLNFMFHFSMARMLSVSDFGTLAALFSIIYIFSLFAESIQTVIVKYTSRESNKGKIKNIIKRALKKGLKISLLLFIVFAILAYPLSFLLKIDYLLLLVTVAMVFFIFTMPIIRGVLQGKKRFYELGFNMISESFLKIAVAVVLVFLGFKVFGAMLGAIFSSLAALAISSMQIRDILASKESKERTDEIYAYSKPTFVLIFTIMAFFSIDILIAKIVFSSELAGTYALASILAKTIFFGTAPISKALFPLSSSEKSKGKNQSLLISSLFILALCIIIALLLFYFFSDFIIKTFSGKSIPEASFVLFYIAIAMSLISITNLVVLYKLSVGKIKRYYLLPVFFLIEIVLLFLFSNSLFQFASAFIASSAILLWASVNLLGE